jgi:prevent-host-death family protein
MAMVNIHEAKTHFSKLLRRVAAGEIIVISRGGVPVARLVPEPRPQEPRVLGAYRDAVTWTDDFDAPLPDTLLEAFEGADPH